MTAVQYTIESIVGTVQQRETEESLPATTIATDGEQLTVNVDEDK